MAEIRVDSAKCQGHAMCYGVDPELFPLDEQGFSAVSERTIADPDLDAARRAVEACPERAISVHE
jgi:ferredoxin